MKKYDELLETFLFFRIHYAHVIQLDKITKYLKGNGGYVVMKAGHALDVSARKKDEFLKKLTDIK